MTYNLIWFVATIHNLTSLIYSHLRPLCCTGILYFLHHAPFKIKHYSAIYFCKCLNIIDNVLHPLILILSPSRFNRSERYIIYRQIFICFVKIKDVPFILHDSLNSSLVCWLSFIFHSAYFLMFSLTCSYFLTPLHFS